MLHKWLRIIKSVSGTLTDLSIENQDEAININIADANYILIGKHYPTNNFFFMNSVANNVVSTINIKYWDGTDWRDTVDVLDGTSTAGATLAKSGVIQFAPQEKYNWAIVGNTINRGAPSELATKEITNLYWLKITFSAPLLSTSRINRITYAFTQSQEVSNLDVSVNDYLTSFGTGKTDWNKEIITASLHVVKDLQAKGLIVNEGEILRFDDVSLPAAYMTLRLIYSSLGASYVEKRDYYERLYKETISINRFSFDTNENGRLDRGEVNTRTSVLVR